MHELGIASSIVESVLHEMKERNYPSVATIVLRIGKLTDVDSDALSFGFEVITKDTALATTKLDIQRIPITVQCENCKRQSEVENYLFVCPHCDSREVTVKTGTELDIAYLEIPD
jgi:hydrogenase nickel incorporation protein HypA/HybF